MLLSDLDNRDDPSRVIVGAAATALRIVAAFNALAAGSFSLGRMHAVNGLVRGVFREVESSSTAGTSTPLGDLFWDVDTVNP